MSTPLLQTENLTKRFGEVIANNDVTFDVVAGEIHCLFGENGAGKSTLSACLSGYYRPDGGRILYQGRPAEMRSPADAIRLGIGIVHQHFVLVPRFTVLENIIVGTQTAGLRLRTDEAKREILKICDTYGIRLDLDAVVETLSVGEQQWVEILKALYLGARLLIMDEPTAVLTPQQSERLFDLIRAMRAKGMSIIIISHKLREVMQSDRVTVLRKGRVVATVCTAETTPQALTNLMIGRELVAHDRVNGATRGAAVLTLSEVNSLGDRGEAALQDVSLSIHAGAYLLLRISPLLSASPEASLTLVLVGGVTAVQARLSGRAQTDAKSALGYATVTQVGIIFVEIGLGFYRLAAYHLFAHACVRAFQLLRAPSLLAEVKALRSAAGEIRRASDGAVLSRLPVAVRAWLYRAALDRFYTDDLLELLVLLPALRLARFLDGGQRAFTDALLMWPAEAQPAEVPDLADGVAPGAEEIAP